MLFLSPRRDIRFNIKPKSTIQHWKWAKITYIWFWVHWLAEHAPKFDQYRFIKFGRLTGRDPKEVAKLILQLLFPTRRRVLIKKQTALPHKEQWRKWLIFDSGCTGWQSMSRNLVNVDLPNWAADSKRP